MFQEWYQEISRLANKDGIEGETFRSLKMRVRAVPLEERSAEVVLGCIDAELESLGQEIEWHGYMLNLFPLSVKSHSSSDVRLEQVIEHVSGSFHSTRPYEILSNPQAGVSFNRAIFSNEYGAHGKSGVIESQSVHRSSSGRDWEMPEIETYQDAMVWFLSHCQESIALLQAWKDKHIVS